MAVRAINKIGRLNNKHPLTHITLLPFLQTPSYFFDVSCIDCLPFKMSLQVSLCFIASILSSSLCSVQTIRSNVSIVRQSTEGYSTHVYISLFNFSSGKFKVVEQKQPWKQGFFYCLHEALNVAGTIVFTAHALYLSNMLNSLSAVIHPHCIYCNCKVRWFTLHAPIFSCFLTLFSCGKKERSGPCERKWHCWEVLKRAQLKRDFWVNS